MDITGMVEAVARGYPLLASFLVAFVSNAVPYMTVPYLAVIAGYGAVLNSLADRVLIAVVAGVGAALGKVVVFMFGRGVHRVLPERVKENVELLAKAFSKGVFVAVFLFAALPLPDDLLYIPVGMTGYSVLKFFVAVASGKIVLTLAAVMAGGLVREFTGGSVGLNVVLGLVALGVIASIITLRANWRKIVVLYNERGALRALVELIVQMIVALLPSRIGRRIESRVDSVLGGVGESQAQPQGRHT